MQCSKSHDNWSRRLCSQFTCFSSHHCSLPFPWLTIQFLPIVLHSFSSVPPVFYSRRCKTAELHSSWRPQSRRTAWLPSFRRRSLGSRCALYLYLIRQNQIHIYLCPRVIQLQKSSKKYLTKTNMYLSLRLPAPCMFCVFCNGWQSSYITPQIT